MGRALGSPEEKADIIGPHKWPGFVGERKETLAYGRAATAFLPEELRARIARSHRVFVGRVGWRRPAASIEVRRGPAIGPALAIRGSAPRPTLQRRTASSPVVCCRRQPNREAGSDVLPVSGGATSTMRAHAVAATAIARIRDCPRNRLCHREQPSCRLWRSACCRCLVRGPIRSVRAVTD